MADKNLYKTLKDEYLTQKSYRESKVDPRMQDAVELVLPRYGTFGTESEWKDRRYDTIGTECASLRSKGFFGNLSPSAAPWFRYQFVDTDANKDKARLKILEKFTEHMMSVFNESTYYRAGPEWFLVATCLPFSVLDIREDKETQTIVCTVDHPRAGYIKVNARNEVVGVWTRRYLTADQAAMEFGEDVLDPVIKTALSRPGTEQYEFVDAIALRKNWKVGSKLNSEWKWGDYTFRTGSDQETFYYEGGTREFPKAILREGLRGNDPYAYSPIDEAMPDIRTCNQMARTMIHMKNKQADPATWYPKNQPTWNTNPGSRHFYSDPNMWIKKDDIGNYVFDDKAHDFFHKRVRNALNVDAFLMLMQLEGQMTAREVLERKREGMSVTSADLGNAQRELDHVHKRFIEIENDAGRLEEFAEILKGQQIKIEYVGLLPQQQKQVYMESGIVSALQTEAAIFTLWPLEKFRIKPQVLTEDIWRSNAAPEDALASDDEYNAAVEAFQKAQIQQQQAAIAASVAGRADPMKKPEQGSPAESMMAGQVG